MKHYMLFEAKLLLKNRKNSLLIILFGIFLVGIIFFINLQGVGNLEKQIYHDLQNNTIAIERFNELERENPETQPSYKNVLSQQRAIARQDVNLRFEDNTKFLQASITLANLRIQGHELGYKGVPSSFFVNKIQAEKDLLYYTYLLEKNIPIVTDDLNGANYLSVTLVFLGSFIFFILLLLSSDVLTADFSHNSLVMSFPLIYKQRVWSKLVIHVCFNFLMICLLLFTVTGIVSAFFGLGIFASPFIFYLDGSYTVISIWQQAILSIVYMLVLCVHIVLLCTLLNSIFKNMYLSIFAAGILYVLPNLFSSFFKRMYWLPMNYYNYSPILNGTFAEKFQQPQFDYSSALWILTAWSGIILFLLSNEMKYRKRRSHTDYQIPKGDKG